MASLAIPPAWKICLFVAYSSVVKSGAGSVRGSGVVVSMDGLIGLKGMCGERSGIVMRG